MVHKNIIEMKKRVFILGLLLLSLAGIFSACKEKETLETQLLENTKWKLIGFFDTIADTIKIAEPESEMCYLLSFDKNKTLFGISSTNEFQGSYKIDYSTNIINITIGQITEINELFDGKLYIKSLNNVEIFSLIENELRLYYNSKQNYLLFKSRQL